jgi:hypothetical protein
MKPNETKAGHAVELFRPDGHGAGIFYCSECRGVYSTKLTADRCHGVAKCDRCGEEVCCGSVCNACQHKDFMERERVKEAERFENAVKVAAADYGSWVFCDGVGHNNGYFESVDEFLEWAEDNYAGPSHVPAYVWACEDIGIRGANDFASNVLDGMWEDAELDDLYGVSELEAAIALFNEANKSISVWFPDYSKAIMLAGASEAS